MTTNKQRLKQTLAKTASKAARCAELAQTIDALIEQADADLDVAALTDLALPNCPLARKVAAAARQALSAETQTAP